MKDEVVVITTASVHGLSKWADFHDPLLLSYMRFDSVLDGIVFGWLVILTWWIVRHSRGG